MEGDGKVPAEGCLERMQLDENEVKHNSAMLIEESVIRYIIWRKTNNNNDIITCRGKIEYTGKYTEESTTQEFASRK